MKLAIMTKSTFFVEEDKILSSLFDEGMDNLHLFKPGSSPMYAERLLTLLPEDYLRKITLHDHYSRRKDLILSCRHCTLSHFLQRPYSRLHLFHHKQVR